MTSKFILLCIASRILKKLLVDSMVESSCGDLATRDYQLSCNFKHIHVMILPLLTIQLSLWAD